jgi:hypothetical protein
MGQKRSSDNVAQRHKDNMACMGLKAPHGFEGGKEQGETRPSV